MQHLDGSEHIWAHADRIPYHVAQLESPYRSTVHFGRFLADVVGGASGDALDVGCGAGQDMLYLARHLPWLRWTGVDIAGNELFPIGRPYFERHGVDASLVVGDFLRLTELFPDRRFDVVISVQTLSFIADFRPVLEQMLAVAGRWVVLSSLFTEFDVDARITATDYTRSPEAQGPFYYNVFSLRSVRLFCADRGWRRVISRDFDIDIDLPVSGKGLSTHTRLLADGHRLQISGPLLMPWKFVAIGRSDD